MQWNGNMHKMKIKGGKQYPQTRNVVCRSQQNMTNKHVPLLERSIVVPEALKQCGTNDYLSGKSLVWPATPSQGGRKPFLWVLIDLFCWTTTSSVLFSRRRVEMGLIDPFIDFGVKFAFDDSCEVQLILQGPSQIHLNGYLQVISADADFAIQEIIARRNWKLNDKMA